MLLSLCQDGHCTATVARLILQEAGQTLPDDRVVIGNHNADHKVAMFERGESRGVRAWRLYKRTSNLRPGATHILIG